MLSGWVPLERPVTFGFYESWLKENMHGEMAYLKRHASIKESPQSHFHQAQSALVFAIPYRPHPSPRADFPLSSARIASYAQGGDYHHWLKEKLFRLVDKLRRLHPEAHFEVHTDSSPLLERDLAVRAGLGWFGKNTCVIDRKHGSFFLLGEILTSLPAPEDQIEVADFCGTCTRCLEACPTQAIVSPRKLDARRCLSYLSIESRELPPQELRPLWGDWFFGCDLCQSVCPWNQKPFQISAAEKAPTLALTTTNRTQLIEEMRWILTASGKQIEKALKGTALSRAGGFGLKRNALMVIAHQHLTELQPEVEALTSHERLGELASWCLSEL